MVEVYRNLHTGNYSIRDVATGRVVDHRATVTLSGATFVVRLGGRERVLRERRKNVHAFVRGEIGEGTIREIRVTYNPYKAPYFFDANTGRAVAAAERVTLNPEGVFAEGIAWK